MRPEAIESTEETVTVERGGERTILAIVLAGAAEGLVLAARVPKKLYEAFYVDWGHPHKLG